MRQDKILDPTKHPVRGWYYDPLENWWFHRHRKGIWPFTFGKKYYVETNRDGFCEKCGKQIPEDIKKLVRKTKND